MGIESFTGPLTAVAISDWLSRCEEDFDAYDETNPTQKLTNKQKVQRAVSSISTVNVESKSLSTWYTQNRRTLETKPWDTFRDQVKDHTLGKGWRIKVLRDFYTHNQGTVILDDYFQKFEDLKFTVARSSKLTEIDEMVYKCHVLFGTRPDFVAKYVRMHKNDQEFLDGAIDDIRTELREYESEAGTTVPLQVGTPAPFQASTATTFYITSGLFGSSVSTSGSDTIFSSLLGMSTSPTAGQRLTGLYCYYNDYSAKPQIQAFYLYVVGGVTGYYPPTYHHTSKSLHFDLTGEYLKSVTMTRDNPNSAISSMKFMTTLQKEYFIGSAIGEVMTFIAPANWQIIGFHGTSGSNAYEAGISGSYRYPITRLGVIFAPIL